MNNKELNKIINHFGSEYQKIKALEELNELESEILKGLTSRVNIDALKSEIADVENMLDQLKIIYNISSYEIDEIRLFKMQRTLNLVENG